jgi:hypothetical protein
MRPAERVALLDELGKLGEDLAGVKAKAERFEALKRIVRGWADAEADAEAEIAYEGKLYVVQASAKPNERSADNRALLKRIGQAAFLKVARVTVKAMEAILPGDEVARLTIEERTGSRRITAARRAALGRAA